MRRNVLVALLISAMLLSSRLAIGQQPPEIELYAMNSDGTNARRIAAVPGFPIINSPEPSPDGKWVAVDGWNHQQSLTDARLLIINVHTGIVRDLGLGAMPTWSPDGKWFGYSKYSPDAGLFVQALDGSAERIIDRRGWAIQLAPDGLKAAYSRGGNIVVYDFIGDTKREIFNPNKLRYRHIYHNMEWSPDSQRICFHGTRADGSEEISIASVTGEPGLVVRCDGKDYIPDIAWHPEGSRVLLARHIKPDQPGQIDEFDPQTFEPPKSLAGQPTDRNNQGLGWSWDGKTLYFVSWPK